MQHLEVRGVADPYRGSLGVKGLKLPGDSEAVSVHTASADSVSQSLTGLLPHTPKNRFQSQKFFDAYGW